MGANYERIFYKNYELLRSKNKVLKLKNALFREEIKLLKAVEAKSEKLEAQLEQEKAFYKDELDYKVVVIKKRHAFSIWECKACGRDSHALIPNNLKEANQYGRHVRALLLSLMNIGGAR